MYTYYVYNVYTNYWFFVFCLGQLIAAQLEVLHSEVATPEGQGVRAQGVANVTWNPWELMGFNGF